ncbi:MAG TPA: WYL domain-containing protein [Pseudonocardiaceae bacterium]|jgi:proteasome accessory factor C|nr:WYL domain-containing protein [Pseudonocardiaceae bacterium]
MSTAADRLPRLLALVPYLIARPGIPVEEAAADFGVSARQLRKDLELLWMCGLPGYGPGDLIDLSFEGDTITVTYDAGMRRPLRLTAAEATALLVALRALADTPGIDDPDAVRRALAKVETAAGAAQPAGVVVGLAMREEQVTTEVREAVRDAIQRQRALHITYYTASRDEMSERTVDPMRVLLVEGRSYLEAWCRSAEDVRRFRLDRIDGIEVLDEPAMPPPHARPQDVSEGLFRPAADQLEAQLVLEPDARWIAEYYPVEDLQELDGGRARVRIRYSDTSWMIRLLLAQAGDVAVEEPAELREGVLVRARQALQRAEALAD